MWLGQLEPYHSSTSCYGPCKVAKRHADACTPVDLYQRVGGSSEPPEPPQHTGLHGSQSCQCQLKQNPNSKLMGKSETTIQLLAHEAQSHILVPYCYTTVTVD